MSKVFIRIDNLIKDDENTRLNFAETKYTDFTGRKLKKYNWCGGVGESRDIKSDGKMRIAFLPFILSFFY